MNSKNLSKEFIYQGLALLLSIILVHAFFVSVVRPEAQAVIQEQQAMIAEDINYVPERSLYVIIKDFEQEACFILMLWAFAIMTLKARMAVNERKLLQEDLIPLQQGMRITREDTSGYLRQLDNLAESKQSLLLPRILTNALNRFATTGKVQDAATSAHTMVESEADRLESELSMIRYIAWAIPSIGFIGTVRGIGAALSLAHRAADGDITSSKAEASPPLPIASSSAAAKWGRRFSSVLSTCSASSVLSAAVHSVTKEAWVGGAASESADCAWSSATSSTTAATASEAADMVRFVFMGPYFGDL